MSVGKEYSILIFGIDAGGGVITDILEQKVTPKSASADVKLDMSFSNFRENGNTNYLDVNIVPSDKEAKYVFDYLPEDNVCVQLDCTDEEFVEQYTAVQGQYLSNMTYTGDVEKKFAMGQEWNSVLGTWAWGKYTIFIFGYDGEQTSRLLMYEVNAETGEYTQIRGGEPTE